MLAKNIGIFAKARAMARAKRNKIFVSTDADMHIHPYQARNSLIHFTQATFPTYKADPVHYFIANELEKILRGEYNRLILLAPPQHGKTELVSKRFPAYWLGHRPNHPVISTSYSGDRAIENGEIARDIVGSEEFAKIFPDVRLRGDSKKKDLWKLERHRGYLRSAGVGGGITGLGALLGIIDDPYASWAAAHSESGRRVTEEWYRGTFRTRIWEGGAIVIIMTRWHEEDLVGWLLKTQPTQWKVVRLPAIAESQDMRDEYAEEYGLPLGEGDPLGRQEGEALSPSRFSIQELQKIRQEITPYFFDAEYQGRPRPMEGLIFQAAWFEKKFISEHDVPKDAVRVRYWDKAGTEGAGAYTVGLLMARDWTGKFYVEDIVRGQWSAMKREQVMEETAQRDWERYGEGMVEWWVEQEPGSGGKESTELTLRRLAKYGVRADRTHEAKGIRIKPFLAQCEAGNVYVVENHAWTQQYMAELLQWSEQARIKDQADASSGAMNKLFLDDFIGGTDTDAVMEALHWRGR
jgi:predicted phage terminase large subunit-like protein